MTTGNGSAADPTAGEIATLGYEQARDELVDVVKALEQGGLDLDASLALWERGEALANRCEEHLAGARRRIATALDAAEDPDRSESDRGTPTGQAG
ncbi:exodeoxyribonuclease VII small subunit [Skermania piniformis]|uniref:Exodeoxyribonuclease 7 small subunit n=1 Tax=Skermania pinensis TaxID=39122 RepID=A0ABX8SA30_9ACTN|nr:exodeoxyribonuclease VII small subunit [Skermania piniformis]MCB1293054.1 exodeoxyribonuclease VII small subunit [Mycobacterium sp.]QXQ14677.1 exodeoxyribonuclease VII small subunit [Skermania piniformis]